jgi:ribosomal protein S18 acetylase RimI-like enzyme
MRTSLPMPSDPAVSEAEPRFRRAAVDDVPPIVRLLASDPLGARRERLYDPLPRSYFDAFAAIESDPNQELVVSTLDDRIVGVLQLTFIPSLTYQGSWRAQIEGVRVEESVRSMGIGRRLLDHAIGRARDRGCRLVQLTSDKRRPRALEFYERLGFVASHEGMKLHLTDGA